MARKQQIQDLMAAIGPMIDPLAVSEFEAENTWTLQIDEDTLLIIDLDEKQDKLVFTTEIGVPTGDRVALNERLLCLNYHWDTTGGVRMALDGPQGAVVQLFDLPCAELEPSRLARVIANFLDTARAWRAIVVHGQSQPAEEPASSTFGEPWLRV